MDAVQQVQPDPDVVPASAPERVEQQERQAAAVEAFARGHEGLTADDERDALDWLMAGLPASPYGVPVTLDTPSGPQEATWVISAQDGKKLDEIEQRHISKATGQMDVIGANCEVVAQATIELRTARRVVDIRSTEFLTMMVLREGSDTPEAFVHASPAEAIAARFRKQMGIVQGVAAQVRRISGYNPELVGEARRRDAGDAQRRVAAAVGNS